MKFLGMLCISCLCFSAGSATARQHIPLEGTWQVKLDSANVGVQEKWYHQQFSQRIQLPGTLDDAGLGRSNNLSADKLVKDVLINLIRKHTYIGVAWYAREILIPKDWKDKDISLYLERVIWNTRVWIDGQEAGVQESLSVPHRFDLSALAKPGRHRLVIRIDNSKQYDMTHLNMAHAYTDGTQIIWNGVIGKMELMAKDKINIATLQTYPRLKDKSVNVIATLQNGLKQSKKGILQLQVIGKDKRIVANRSIPVNLAAGDTRQEINIPLGKDALLWDEFNSNLYVLKAQLTISGTSFKDASSTTFGLREITNQGSALQVNGRRVFLRGTLECNIFPLTGHPPMDKKGWVKVFGTAKAYGLNHLRFHSWCPPKAAFEVADSLGFYLQVELPLWSLKTGEDKNTNRFIEEEAQRISSEYGNHPSFCLWSLGNELQGDFSWLAQLLQKLKMKDKRHLYTTTTFTFQKDHGRWPEPGDDYFITQYTKKGWVRGQGIFNTYAPNFSTDYTKAIDSLPVPSITHEIGQYSVYPNLKEVPKYTGVLEPVNFKAISKDLQRKNMLSLAGQFTLASGKFSASLYKEEIERALKTKGLSGFQLLDLHDFPGQGTALVGILDAFWDSKGLVSPAEHRMYTAAIVPLIRFSKAAYTNAEIFEADAEVANFSNKALQQVTPLWTVKNDKEETLFSGALAAKDIPLGNGIGLGKINFSLKDIKKATHLIVELQLKGTVSKNKWSIWVYPEQPGTAPKDMVFATSLSQALKHLNEGRKVLLNPDTTHINGVQGRFAPVFWSPVHFPNQPGTMGLLCDPAHPALADFPTDFYSNWQWWDLITASKTMILDSVPAVDPIVRIIDNFYKNRKMANIVEARVGKGQLIICSMDITTNLEKRPAARQLRYSLEQYMGSNKFNPAVTLSTGDLEQLVKE
ncbi:hypothetical protein HDC92_002522 [Pedobacter sp. AK017]|uniref:sugar-binding domain-containing protein n=1 Tax=Pedobacter sp. AK017 TaxID=2723073 RepID=UPI001621C9BB|nr:sugar-binding domain-containing protein [Pedobacter sp. AK017]MBB5438841.1 hypothetical protein [Pedobacter sp. AK017]